MPIADLNTVLDRLYPDKIKTASESARNNSVSPDYAVPPRVWVEKVALLERAERNAQVIAKHWPAPKPMPGYEPAETNRKLAQLRDLEQAAKDARRKLPYLQAEAQLAVQRIGHYFKQANALPFVTVRDNVNRVYGPLYAELLDLAVGEDKRVKTAAAQIHRVDWTQAPYALVLACENKAVKLAEATAVAASAETKLASYRQQVVPHTPPAVQPQCITGSVCAFLEAEEQAAKVAADKEAAFSPLLPAAIGGSVASLSRSVADSLTQAREKQVQSVLGKLNDPAHEQQLRGIRTQSMLSDLMLHDPVVSGYGQDDVQEAFNRISEVLPNASQHRLIMQAALRRYLEQGNALDTFDIDQLAGLENKLKGLGGPAPAPPQPAKV